MRELSTRPTKLALLPFRGLRFDPRRVDLARVTSAPVEPGDLAAAAAGLSRDEHNMAWLIDPLLAASFQPHERERVALRLLAWRHAGIVRHDPLPSMYVYEHRRAGGSLRGLIAAVSLHDPAEGLVLPHEDVGDAAVARHLALLEATAAQPEPVVLVHPGSQALRALLDETAANGPLVSFGDGGSEHRLWRLSGADLPAGVADEITAQPLLIADGHHRYAAFRQFRAAHGAAAAAPWDFGLTMVVDGGDPGLTLGPIHRVVHGVDWAGIQRTPGLDRTPLTDETAAMAALADVEAPPGRCVITDGTTWLAVAPQPELRDAKPGLPDLAVSHLHTRWLVEWGVLPGDVEHVQASAQAVAMAARSGGLAVLLPSPPLQTVLAAAGRGLLLPAKATSFGPKPRIGMVFRHWPGGFDDLTPAALGRRVSADAAGAGPG